MTKIQIAQRLQPFSHELGVKFLLPRTSLCVQVFPTRIFFVDLTGITPPFWVAFDWTGPVREFTAQLDLERGSLHVFGFAKEGAVRYQIGIEEGWLFLKSEHKRALRVVSSLFPSQMLEQHVCIPLVQVSTAAQTNVNPERLSLGSHKAQDFSQMKRRLDLKELIPHWLQLASWRPSLKTPQGKGGNYALLDQCCQLVKEGRKNEIVDALLCFFLSAFEGVFVPRLVDTEYQGILPEQKKTLETQPTLPLLKQSADCVRSLFYQEGASGELSLLPCLPAQFHCGRMISILTSGGQTVHFDWSKKALRTVFVESPHCAELTLILPKGISSCRLKEKKDNLRKIEVPKEGSLVLPLQAGKRVELDRFEG